MLKDAHLLDPEEFRAKHIPALEADEVRHNLLLGTAERAMLATPSARFWSLGEEARCALQTPPRPIILGTLAEGDFAALAELVHKLDFTGCVGHGDQPARFAEALSPYGVKLELAMPQRIFALKAAPIYPGAAGRGRRATAADEALLVNWLRSFCAEALPNDPVPTEAELRRSVAANPVYLWQVNSELMAMAARTRETKNGSNISWVYTPPALRGRGYAGSVTAFACQALFAEGKRMAFLYTDLTNPISNRVYQKIGFQPHCDSSSYQRLKA